MHGLPHRRRFMSFLAFGLVMGLTSVSHAVHETGVNQIRFVAVAGSPSPNAQGYGETTITRGRIDSAPGNGIDDGTDIWEANFQFRNLAPRTMYTIAVRGRFDQAVPVTGIWTFVTESDGSSRFSFYYAGLARLGYIEVRKGGDDGASRVLTASRPAGQITTVPFGNRWSGW